MSDWYKCEKCQKEHATCPCVNDCCCEPDTYCPEHECPVDEFCEDCYWVKCNNCGRECGCNL